MGLCQNIIPLILCITLTLIGHKYHQVLQTWVLCFALSTLWFVIFTTMKFSETFFVQLRMNTSLFVSTFSVFLFMFCKGHRLCSYLSWKNSCISVWMLELKKLCTDKKVYMIWSGGWIVWLSCFRSEFILLGLLTITLRYFSVL